MIEFKDLIPDVSLMCVKKRNFQLKGGDHELQIGDIVKFQDFGSPENNSVRVYFPSDIKQDGIARPYLHFDELNEIFVLAKVHTVNVTAEWS